MVEFSSTIAWILRSSHVEKPVDRATDRIESELRQHPFALDVKYDPALASGRKIEQVAQRSGGRSRTLRPGRGIAEAISTCSRGHLTCGGRDTLVEPKSTPGASCVGERCDGSSAHPPRGTASVKTIAPAATSCTISPSRATTPVHRPRRRGYFSARCTTTVSVCCVNVATLPPWSFQTWTKGTLMLLPVALYVPP